MADAYARFKYDFSYLVASDLNMVAFEVLDEKMKIKEGVKKVTPQFTDFMDKITSSEDTVTYYKEHMELNFNRLYCMNIICEVMAEKYEFYKCLPTYCKFKLDLIAPMIDCLNSYPFKTSKPTAEGEEPQQSKLKVANYKRKAPKYLTQHVNDKLDNYNMYFNSIQLICGEMVNLLSDHLYKQQKKG